LVSDVLIGGLITPEIGVALGHPSRRIKQLLPSSLAS
jgi:hypothetical protein